MEGVVRELGLNRYYLVGHSMGAKIAAVLPSRKSKVSGARFHSIPDVGHLLPLEAPEEVAKAVRDFIRNR